MARIVIFLAILTMMVSTWLPMCATAQELSSTQELNDDTLQQIRQSGVIQVGYLKSAIPFSYLDNKGLPIGYSIDHANLVVQAIKEKLGLPELRVTMIPLSIQNRIPLLLRGIYDFECSFTTNIRKRHKLVAFSNIFFICSTRMLVERNSGIHDFADLQGKNVVVIAGTTSENNLHDLNDREQLGMRIICAKNYADALQTVVSSLATALVWDDVLLAGEVASRPELHNWQIVGAPLSYEAYGCMLRPRDPQFKQLIDEVIADAQLSGKAEELFQRWFNQPIPPNGINIKFAMSEAMRELFRNPNDRPFQ